MRKASVQRSPAPSFQIIEGTGSTPSCDDRIRVHCKIPEPECYEFKPIGWFWRQEIRRAPHRDLCKYRNSLINEIGMHRREMLELGISCNLDEADRHTPPTLDGCSRLLALLEAHKAVIFDAGYMPPMSEAPRSYIQAHPFVAKNVPRVS